MTQTTFFTQSTQLCGTLQRQRPYLVALLSVGLLCCGLASPWCAALLLVGFAYGLVSRQMAGPGPESRQNSPWNHLAMSKGRLRVSQVDIPISAIQQVVLCRDAGVLMVHHTAHGITALPCLRFDPVYAPAVEAFFSLRLADIPFTCQPTAANAEPAAQLCQVAA